MLKISAAHRDPIKMIGNLLIDAASDNKYHATELYDVACSEISINHNQHEKAARYLIERSAWRNNCYFLKEESA